MISLSIRALLFDLDGTLLDTWDLIWRCFRATFRHYLGRELTKEEFLPIFGQPLFQQMAHFGGEQAEEMVRFYRQCYAAWQREGTRAFPGVVDTLKQLRHRGYRLAAVTSKGRDRALQGLKTAGLDSLLPVVVAVEDVTHPKPHPEPVEKTARRLDVAVSECLVVGDSPVDIQAGKAAGAQTAAVRWTFYPWNQVIKEQPDYTLQTISDLLVILANGRQKTSKNGSKRGEWQCRKLAGE